MHPKISTPLLTLAVSTAVSAGAIYTAWSTATGGKNQLTPPPQQTTITPPPSASIVTTPAAASAPATIAAATPASAAHTPGSITIAPTPPRSVTTTPEHPKPSRTRVAEVVTPTAQRRERTPDAAPAPASRSTPVTGEEMRRAQESAPIYALSNMEAQRNLNFAGAGQDSVTIGTKAGKKTFFAGETLPNGERLLSVKKDGSTVTITTNGQILVIH